MRNVYYIIVTGDNIQINTFAYSNPYEILILEHALNL
jgi:hypothetical protein